MAATITVKGAGKDRKVVLWERDAAHPDGEVMIANDGASHEVGETAQVKRLIGEGALVKVTAAKAEPVVKTPASPPAKTGNP